MPTSQKPRRPFAGNTFLIQSKEYKQLLAQLGYLNQQVSLLQAVVGSMVREQEAESKKIPEALRTAQDVPQEVWDEYERDNYPSAGSLGPDVVRFTETAANDDTFQDPSISGIA